MSSLTCTKLTAWATAAVLIQSIGLTLFIFGFFPVKPTLSGCSGSESFQAPSCNAVRNQIEKVLTSDELQKLYQDLSGIPPSYDRLILMVIDGLPAEFVLGKNGEPPPVAYKEAMPYTQSLIENGIAVGYHSKAAPPTVTMPRLKAMMSGAIGGFLDVAFNFNTQALLDDNLIDQLVEIGWKIVMLGDDTWLKLFPGLFTRHDGVSSFFVKDTVQVDLNVSQHLSHELSFDDWHLLGISKHSTLLSGILMFIITYASPMLAFLSMVMYIAIKDTMSSVTSKNVDSGEYLKNMLGFPCLVPLTVNSILLMAYTILVLLMRNHLFFWSVFSPKYLYACAATVCVDTGVLIVAGTVIHTYLAMTMKKKF